MAKIQRTPDLCRPYGAWKIWGAVISINMTLLPELPAPDAIPLKTAKSQEISIDPDAIKFLWRWGVRVDEGVHPAISRESRNNRPGGVAQGVLGLENVALAQERPEINPEGVIIPGG